MSNLRLGAMNVRGISSNPLKRRDVFCWLKEKKLDIALLSEVHSENEIVNKWIAEWGYKGFFSSYTKSSRGVCILFRNTFEFNIHSELKDVNGRFVILDLTLQEVRMSLVVLYGPNEDDPTFFETIFDHLIRTDNTTFIIAGDLNVVLDYDMDCKNYQGRNNPLSQNIIKDKMQTLGLIDIWRLNNPDKKHYTWFGPNRKMSRLDYFLISEDLLNNVVNADILPGYRTDHSFITLDVRLVKNEKGRGFWKFNNSLLHDTAYVNMVKECIEEVVNQYRTDGTVHVYDPISVPFSISDSLFFDTLKLTIRGKTIPYCAKKKREHLGREHDLESRLVQAEKKYVETQTPQNLEDLQKVKDDLKIIREQRMEGAFIRSKAKWQREGEKCTKYFCNLEKRNYVEKTMSKLKINETGDIITDSKEILLAQEKFYRELYTSRSTYITDDHAHIFFDNNNPYVQKLSNEESMDMDGIIRKEECLNAVKCLKNNKSPGTDGFTAEFYKFFWKDLGDFLIRSFNDSYEEGKLSVSRRQGIITCIPKPGKTRDQLKNWRPITLLNIDYKILTTVLANRIKKHLEKIVTDSQKGYVKGRYIGECTRTILDILSETEDKNIPGLLLLLDFEKAFDSIEWNFIERALSFIGFGDSFIRWFNTLYKDASSCVINNGNFTSFFNVSRGVRQGDPLSPYLFIIALECLSAALKYDKDITGITINDSEYLLEQFADDMTLMLDGSKRSLRQTLKILVSFESCSGLKCNWEKCEAIWIGSKAGSQSTIAVEKPLCWNRSGNFKMLGISASVFDNDVERINYCDCLKSIESVLNTWVWRGLTLMGRATVIKSLALPKLVHLFMILPSPSPEFMKKIERLFFRFLWDRGREKIKRDILFQKHEDGGLKIPDINCFAKALKFIWIKKLLDDDNFSAWKILFLDKILNLGGNLIWEIDPQEMKKLIPKLNTFWGDVLNSWSTLQTKKPVSAEAILSQSIWYNPLIKIQNGSHYIKSLHTRGITYLNDLFDNNGNIISYNLFKQKFGDDIHFLTYHRVVRAIPTIWKNCIRDYGKKLPNVKINTNIQKLKNLDKPTNYFYWSLVDQKPVQISHACLKWANQLENQEINWALHYTSCFTITKEAKLQSFQFKLLHYILATNRELYKMNLSTSDRCCFCEFNRETILHLLYDCHISKTFWLQLRDWLRNAHDINLSINSGDVILGRPIVEKFKELLTIFGKYYIYCCKLNNTLPSLPSFLPILEYRIKLDISSFDHSQIWPISLRGRLRPLTH